MASANAAFPKGDFGEEDILWLNVLYYFLARHPTRGYGQ